LAISVAEIVLFTLNNSIIFSLISSSFIGVVIGVVLLSSNANLLYGNDTIKLSSLSPKSKAYLKKIIHSFTAPFSL